MSTCKGFAAAKAGAPLGPYSFERREAREHDVVIDIKYCGICHSDIHQARDQWSEYQEEAIFPMVPPFRPVPNDGDGGARAHGLSGTGQTQRAARSCSIRYERPSERSG